MTLDFNETCIVNQTLTADNKDDYIKTLVGMKNNTANEEIRTSIDSLIDKVSILDDADFKKLIKDRMEQKIFTYPPYSI